MSFRKLRGGIINRYNRVLAWNYYRKHPEVSVVIGDSHVNFFSGNEELSYTPIGGGINWCRNVDGEHRFFVLHLGSALAYNSIERNTTTKYLEKSGYLLTKLRKGQKVIVCLGEVDMRAHVVQQAEKSGRKLKEVVEDVGERYTKYLLWIKKQGYEVYMWAPPGQQHDSVEVSKKFPRHGDMKTRNQATREFLEYMKKSCERNGIGYRSIFDRLVNRENETRTEYYSADGVHLGQAARELAEVEWSRCGL